MTTRSQECKWCGEAFTIARSNGRPREYCQAAECQYQMKLAWTRRYRQRIKNGYVPRERGKLYPVVFTPPLIPKPITWWVAQAMGIVETCKACEGPVEGVYVAPTVETMGECAVVAHCRTCGRERMVLAGRGGVPYEEQGPGQVYEPRRANTSRRRGPYDTHCR